MNALQVMDRYQKEEWYKWVHKRWYKCYGWDSNFVIEDRFALNCILNSFKLFPQMKKTHWEFKLWCQFSSYVEHETGNINVQYLYNKNSHKTPIIENKKDVFEIRFKILILTRSSTVDIPPPQKKVYTSHTLVVPPHSGWVALK